ncbi:MFS transporter [Curvibacter sp. CHRR-16]|uniref:MFS transporter n=1 Tax=Curvibacter sp. CHRR-16 TaxID=2835872 RepID=UPI001BDA4694|nr:MFS transporter [Curvibacter sp. CHRR-16]MBT0570047.1 MFS transporter [Curvibacter sp. CHRR-16]
MTPAERRASLTLALIFALRMLGLFIVLPVFALEARKYPGGDDVARVGLAMGIYGLTQALLQIPFGIAADRFGRKPVIYAGLSVFVLGSTLAALATSLDGLILGRALQGAGAISAAVTALLADQTRDAVRTKAMAVVGGSIGLVFALSLVLSPVLNSWWGLHGLFAMTATLALAGMAVVRWVVPAEPIRHATGAPSPGAALLQVLRNPALLRLNGGVMVLHAVQLAMWMAVPAMLVQAGLPKAQHWQVYLPTVLLSFVLMGASLFRLERKGYLRAVFLVAIGMVALVQLGLCLSVSSAHSASLAWLGTLMFVFFCGFNVLEASQPSLVSRLAPPAVRGTAMGVYNTLQSLGFFIGGAVGGWVVQRHGAQVLFALGTLAMLLWLAVAWGMQTPAARSGTALH